MPVQKQQVIEELKTRKHFAMIPNELSYAEISIQARQLWAYLASEGPTWDASIANCGRNLGLHRNTVSKAVTELEKYNMLSASVQYSGGSTNFVLFPASMWTVEFREMSPQLIEARAARQMCVDPHQICAGLALTEGGIQKDNTSNTLKTVERKRSSRVRRSEVDFQDKSEKAQSQAPVDPDNISVSFEDIERQVWEESCREAVRRLQS